MLVQKLEFRSGLLEWAETAQSHFSGSAAGVGVTAHLLAGGAITLAFYRPKSKETSAFPKPYPLRNRAIGGEMALVLKNAPSPSGNALLTANNAQSKGKP
jgi:hypothetical protein